MLSPPPFKLASVTRVGPERDPLGRLRPSCCDDDGGGARPEPASGPGRHRFAELDPHLHCSVLGTCLRTGELRRVMSAFVHVDGESDLSLHHDAVALASEARVAKALHKALDKRHDAAIERLSKVRGVGQLEAAWTEALGSGEVPGAYWAILTHRDVTFELRQRVFGDVHMLSHLVGASHRADLRRLVALEKENAELRDDLARQRTRSQDLLGERDAALARLEQQALQQAVQQAVQAEPSRAPDGPKLVAVHTDRRERAEAAAAGALEAVERLQRELAHLRAHAEALQRELAAAETQLHERADDVNGKAASMTLAPRLKGRRVLYVGGRPSSTPAIRDLVERHGGSFQKHDGGFEDRKGLLESAVSWAEFVVFPVDCIDHDSAGRLKRVCARLGTPFVPLRSASVASFAAAAATLDDTRSVSAATGRSALCIRHA